MNYFRENYKKYEMAKKTRAGIKFKASFEIFGFM